MFLILRFRSVQAFSVIQLHKNAVSNRLFTFVSPEEEYNFISKLPFEAKLMIQLRDSLIYSKDSLIQSKDALIQSKDALIQSKDALIQSKDAVISETNESKDALNHAAAVESNFWKYKLVVANTKLLKLSGDLSIRRVIEEIEARSIFKDARKKLQKKIEIDFPNEKKNPSRNEIWTSVLSDPMSVSEYPSLFKLNRSDDNVPVASVIAALYNFASKTVHTIKLDKILIDLDSFTPLQVI